MHSMHVHLAVAKKVNEVLDVEKDSLYIGSVIADLDKFANKKTTTHFQKKELINDVGMLLPSYTDYTKKYKDKFKNPVYLGYLIHLMTDYYFNKHTFSNYWVIEDGIIVGAKLNNGNIRYGDSSSRKRFRLNDYFVFDHFLQNNKEYETPQYTEQSYKNIKKFKILELSKDDIFALIESINLVNDESLVKKIFKNKYKLYTNETIKNTFDECVNFILDYINKEQLIIKEECK